jgi:tRNA uridine 5-carboxymethylaminomethyl modification enzyme
MKKYDLIVVGGGHAGIEAALVGAKMGKNTLLITMQISQIGAISCNPAIGGLAKGHLVKEIDALGGQMGLITDQAGIQFRVLNASKGPAVRGSRAQVDMDRYTIIAKEACLNQPNLSITQEMVEELIIDGSKIIGVKTALNISYHANAVVLTTGTFLNGLVHVGSEQINMGRMGELPANRLGTQLKELGLTVGRLKTGTCPRIAGKSIDFAKITRQANEENPTPFSFRDRKSVV